jgi:hypothetical protein
MTIKTMQSRVINPAETDEQGNPHSSHHAPPGNPLAEYRPSDDGTDYGMIDQLYQPKRSQEFNQGMESPGNLKPAAATGEAAEGAEAGAGIASIAEDALAAL